MISNDGLSDAANTGSGSGGSGPSRQIVKWLQSLNLQTSTSTVGSQSTISNNSKSSYRNYKRDFGNGYLIAAILSKYYPSFALPVSQAYGSASHSSPLHNIPSLVGGIGMHSFENGTGLSCRRGNWLLLDKIFQKLNFPVPKQLLNSLIASNDTSGNTSTGGVFNGITSHSYTSPMPSHHNSYTGINQQQRDEEDEVTSRLYSKPKPSSFVERLTNTAATQQQQMQQQQQQQLQPLSITKTVIRHVGAGGPTIDISSSSLNGIGSGVGEEIVVGVASSPFISHLNSNQAQQSPSYSSFSQSSMQADKGGSSTSLNMTKILVSIFTPTTPTSLKFVKGLYSSSLARECLMLSGSSSIIPTTLANAAGRSIQARFIDRKKDVIYCLQTGAISADYQAIFETFLPLLSQLPLHAISGPGSSYSSLTFLEVVTVLQEFGHLCNSTFQSTSKNGGGESPYKRLQSSREFLNLFKNNVGLKYLERIGYVGSIIQAYIGDTCTDQECVRIFLDLKGVIGSNSSSTSMDPPQMQQSSGVQPSNNANSNTNQGVGSGHTEYIFFLAAFNGAVARESLKLNLSQHGSNSHLVKKCIHSATNQLTVFHLSECLTVINSYKSSSSRKLLLINKNEEKNTPKLVLVTPQDLPSLEVSAVLHVLSSLLGCGVSLDLKILTDVVCSGLRIFFKIVIHSGCPSTIRKAYIKVMIQLLPLSSSTLEFGQNSPGSGVGAGLGIGGVAGDIRGDIYSALVLMMRKFRGDVLIDLLGMVCPLLIEHPCLSASFVSALLGSGLSGERRTALLKSNSLIGGDYDLPFLFDGEGIILMETWSPFIVIMGLIKSVDATRSPFTASQLELLQVCMERKSTLYPLTTSCLDTIFNKIAERLIVSLGIEESSQGAWDVFALFMVGSTPTLVLKKFPLLVSTLIYVHTLEATKCRRRLMGRLRKLSTLDLELIDKKTDRYAVFCGMSPFILRGFQLESERVLSIFRSEFGAIATHKPNYLKNVLAGTPPIAVLNQ